MGILAGPQKMLLRPLLAKTHVVYMDNYYTSPDLVAEPKIAGTGVTGTVRANRKHESTEVNINQTVESALTGQKGTGNKQDISVQLATSHSVWRKALKSFTPTK